MRESKIALQNWPNNVLYEELACTQFEKCAKNITVSNNVQRQQKIGLSHAIVSITFILGSLYIKLEKEQLVDVAYYLLNIKIIFL